MLENIMQFAIFRVSQKKYKTMKQIQAYQLQMERQQNTPNADNSIKNMRLIGSENIVRDVERYIEGIKLRKNGNIANNILLTCTPKWFQNVTEDMKYKWVETNVEFLKKEFGSNCVYATLYKGESSWHISALIVSKLYNERLKKYRLSSNKYFDGKKKLSEWQDKYSAAMKEFGLNRGRKYSKAKHMEIRQFYTLVNENTNEKDLKQLSSKAKNNKLLEIKTKRLQDTLKAYRIFINKTHKEKQEFQKQNMILYKQLWQIKQDRELFKEFIKAMSSNLYKIPQCHIEKVLKCVTEKCEDMRKIDREIND